MNEYRLNDPAMRFNDSTTLSYYESRDPIPRQEEPEKLEPEPEDQQRAADRELLEDLEFLLQVEPCGDWDIGQKGLVHRSLPRLLALAWEQVGGRPADIEQRWFQ